MRVNFTNFNEIRVSSDLLRPLWAFTVRKRKLINHFIHFRHVYSAFTVLMVATLGIGAFSLLTGQPGTQQPEPTSLAFIQPLEQTPTPSSSAIAIGGNPLHSWNTYSNNAYQVTMQYPPEFFSACCFADSPFAEMAENTASFATSPNSQSEVATIKSFTVYVIPNKQKQAFETFVKTQKQNLIAVSRVGTKSPSPRTEQTINSNDQTGYILHGYLFNADVAILPTPDNDAFLVIVARPITTADQDNRFYTILSTVTFNK